LRDRDGGSRSFPIAEHLDTLGRLWRHPGASREALVRFQGAKLSFLVAHAHRHVPYYRHLFERAGVRPADIRSAADLVRLPVSPRLSAAIAGARGCKMP